MRWQFHYPKRTSFYPSDYDNPGLGGCEASLVLLTRALAARGHDVEVFNCCYRPGTYDGVTWRMTWELDTAPAPDVAVAVRFDEALWPADSKAGHHLFWMLDDRTRGPAAFADTFRDRGGRVVLASQAMQQRLGAASVDIPTHLIPLPVETERYTRPLTGRAPICLFASMPNRGLDATLALWPRIRAAVPDAELWVTSGWQLWGFTNSESDDRWHQLLGGHPLPDGVRLLGTRPRAELIEIQQQAALTLYPCRFPEMFCLSAAESAAAALPSSPAPSTPSPSASTTTTPASSSTATSTTPTPSTPSPPPPSTSSPTSPTAPPWERRAGQESRTLPQTGSPLLGKP